MAMDQKSNKPSFTTWEGPKKLGMLVPAVVRPTFRKQSPAAAQLMADWSLLMGDYLAANTMPRRLSNGVLTLGCTGPIAMELQHMQDQLISRINGAVGQALVRSIKFVQTGGPAVTRPATTRKPATVAASRAVETLPPGSLRDALEKLGRHILTD